jgi:hypothetical protein
MAPNVSHISDLQPAALLNPCQVTMTVSIRRGRTGSGGKRATGDSILARMRFRNWSQVLHLTTEQIRAVMEGLAVRPPGYLDHEWAEVTTQ